MGDGERHQYPAAHTAYRDYAAYDTLACVGNLQKSFKEGDMLSEEEILSLRRNEQQANMDGVVKPSRKWRRNQKKMYK